VLAQLQRFSSGRNKRAGDNPKLDVTPAFVVVMFKKFSPDIPPGLTVDAFAKFFTDLFTYQTTEERDSSYTSTQALLNNSLYTVLAIKTSQLMHFIVGAALYMFYKKHGNFVNMIGVTAVGDPSVCTLSYKFFIDSSDSGVLSHNSGFCGQTLHNEVGPGGGPVDHPTYAVCVYTHTGLFDSLRA
jgi:hypothetical protein